MVNDESRVARRPLPVRLWTYRMSLLFVVLLVSAGCGKGPGKGPGASEEAEEATPTAPTVTIEEVTAEVTEGADVEFTVTATSAPATDLVVNVRWSDPGEVLAATPPQRVTIRAGKTTAVLSEATVDDSTDEADSRVTVTVNAGAGYSVGDPGSARVTVSDGGTPIVPAVTIEEVTAEVTEGADVEFTVTATSAPATDLVVNVRWSDPGEVLAATPPQTVTIRAGDTTAALAATTVDDSTDEDDSRVTVTVNADAGYSVGEPGSARVTVTDDDGTGTVPPPQRPPPQRPPPQRPPPQPPSQLTVRLASVTPSPVTEGDSLQVQVELSRAPDTKQNGGIYVIDSVTGRLTKSSFSIGSETVEEFSGITVPNTSDVETDRTVTVHIDSAFVQDNDYVLGTPSVLTVSVTDTDS